MIDKIKEILSRLEFSLSTLQEINASIKENIRKKNNHLDTNLEFGKNFILKDLINDFNKLNNIYHENNKTNNALSMYLGFLLQHLETLFKEATNNNDIYFQQTDTCLEEIKKFPRIIQKFQDKTLYDQYFEELKKMSKSFKNLNNDFLLQTEINIESLAKYKQLIDEYKTKLDNKEILDNEIEAFDKALLFTLLESNYDQFKNNLKDIYLAILEENEPFLFKSYYDKCKKSIEKGYFVSIFDSKLIEKSIFSDDIRNKLKISFEKCIKGLDQLIDDFISKKVNKTDTIQNSNTVYDKADNYEIDIPNFVR